MKLFRFRPKVMDGIFAIHKPSGVTSSQFLGKIQKIFTQSDVFHEDMNKAKEKVRYDLKSNARWSQQKVEKKVRDLKVKIGHGGTLDPLASGVLVVGIGLGTKKLQYYLTECEKQYETKALLGISTTTGDSEGEIITKNPVDHITKEMILETAPKFVGSLKQTPPIFSALKLNGMPFYEYARKGIALPAPIKTREIKVMAVKVFEEDSLQTDHGFEKLESKLDENGKPVEHGLANNPTLNDSPLYFSNEYMEKAEAETLPKEVGKPRTLGEDESLPEILPLFHLTADVSSGTYIRSLISDFGRALESSAYMVELIRTKQSEWELNKNVFRLEDFTEKDERVWGPVLKKVFDEGSEIDVKKELELIAEKVMPLIEKEKEVLARVEKEKEAKEEEKEAPVEADNAAPVEADNAAPVEAKDIEAPVEVSLPETTPDATSSELPKKRHIDEV